MKRLTSVALVCLFLAALGAITATPPVEAQTVKPEAPRITKATYNRLDRIVVRFTAPDDPNVDGYVVNLDGSRVRSVVVPRDKRRLAIPADELTAGAEHTIFVKAITADGTLSRHSNRVKVRVPNDHPQTNPPAQSGETINRVAAVLRHLGCDDARAGTFAAVGVFTIDELFANADICIATPIPTTTTTGPPRTVPTTEAPITIPGDDGPEPTPSTTDPSAPLPAPSIVSAVKCSDIENSNITFLFSSTVEERTLVIPTVNGKTFAAIELQPNRNDYSIPGSTLAPAGLSAPFTLQLQIGTGEATSLMSEAKRVTSLRCTPPGP